MILAIIGRYENIEGEEPFHEKFYFSTYFKKIFDDMGILLFPVISEKGLDKVCDLCDGLIVTGTANNISPHYYKESPLVGTSYDIDEYCLDQKVIDTFHTANKPILGICGGLQSINVFFGGTLHQKILGHHLKDSYHPITIEENSFLFDVYQTKHKLVNSFHYQAICTPAPGFKVIAKSDDDIIEAIEKDNIIAVQWHPEQLLDMDFFNHFLKRFLS